MERHIDAAVVDASPVARELLERMLAVRCRRVWSAGSVAQALAAIADAGVPHLLLVDGALADGGPSAFLRRLEVGETDVVGVLRHRDPARAAALLHDGALAVLHRPLTERDLAAVLRQVRRGEFPEVATRVRGRAAARAQVLDDEGVPVVSWEVQDLSVSGALLRSHAPVPVGTELALALAFGPCEARTRARVVRIQEPAWGVIPGVAVRFLHGEDGVAEVVRAMGGRV